MVYYSKIEHLIVPLELIKEDDPLEMIVKRLHEQCKYQQTRGSNLWEYVASLEKRIEELEKKKPSLWESLTSRFFS